VDYFGSKTITRDSENQLTITVGDASAQISLPSLEVQRFTFCFALRMAYELLQVSTTSPRLRAALTTVVKRFRLLTNPYQTEE